jgi:uncharacterized protein
VIFVDTSFWVAIFNKRDSRSADAQALYRAHYSVGLLTTNHVCGETWTFLQQRAGRKAAVDFLETVEHTARADVQFVGEELEDDAWQWLRRHDERRYSFVDATSFAVMRSLKIEEALAFDGGFAAAGFVELRA